MGLSKNKDIYIAMDKEEGSGSDWEAVKKNSQRSRGRVASYLDKFANGRIESSRWVGVYQMMKIVIL